VLLAVSACQIMSGVATLTVKTVEKVVNFPRRRDRRGFGQLRGDLEQLGRKLGDDECYSLSARAEYTAEPQHTSSRFCRSSFTTVVLVASDGMTGDSAAKMRDVVDAAPC
jgi:hypothetical protein